MFVIYKQFQLDTSFHQVSHDLNFNIKNYLFHDDATLLNPFTVFCTIGHGLLGLEINILEILRSTIIL